MENRTNHLLALGILGVGMLCLCLLGVLVTAGDGDYSSGHRDGQVQKFSHKGLFRKSWEGEMALPGFGSRGDGPISNVWQFSVHDADSDVIAALQDVRGDQMVRLHYRQTLLYNPLAHESNYRITRVEVLSR